MPGFSLAKKQWCYFKVDWIEDVELNSRAFDRLLLADGQKEDDSLHCPNAHKRDVGPQ